MQTRDSPFQRVCIRYRTPAIGDSDGASLARRARMHRVPSDPPSVTPTERVLRATRSRPVSRPSRRSACAAGASLDDSDARQKGPRTRRAAGAANQTQRGKSNTAIVTACLPNRPRGRLPNVREWSGTGLRWCSGRGGRRRPRRSGHRRRRCRCRSCPDSGRQRREGMLGWCIRSPSTTRPCCC